MHETPPISELDEPTYTVAEFAAAVGAHPMTVYRWVSRGLLEHDRTLTGRIRIPESAKRSVVTRHPARTAHAELESPETQEAPHGASDAVQGLVPVL